MGIRACSTQISAVRDRCRGDQPDEGSVVVKEKNAGPSKLEFSQIEVQLPAPGSQDCIL